MAFPNKFEVLKICLSGMQSFCLGISSISILMLGWSAKVRSVKVFF